MKKNYFFTTILSEIQEVFPQAKLEYEFKDFSETHFVKVTSKDVYDDDKFIELEHEFELRFKNSDLKGDICFITEGALTKIENPEITLEPLKPIENIGFIEGRMFSEYFAYFANRVDGKFNVSLQDKIGIDLVIGDNLFECKQTILTDKDLIGNRNFAMAA